MEHPTTELGRKRSKEVRNNDSHLK